MSSTFQYMQVNAQETFSGHMLTYWLQSFPMNILLATLHARYSHASLAIPCLAAACSDLDGLNISLLECTVNDHHDRLLRRFIAAGADLIAFSCYIWNIDAILRLAADIKTLRPECLIILGGPEAAHGSFRLMEENRAIDGIVRGEGELTFRETIAALAQSGKPFGNQLPADIPGLVVRRHDELHFPGERGSESNLDSLPSPFSAGFVELAKPFVYYETSRGCPFSCAFCLSSADSGVRTFSPERIRSDLLQIMNQDVKTVKLVDRTFNFDPGRSDEIWSFILRHNRQSRFHFEIAADLITDANFTTLARVAPETFRFEIGVQSGAAATLAEVSRKSDLDKVFINIRRLLAQTSVTVHLDLVAGLPREDFTGFLDSLEQLLALAPHHIQVEPLKVLKGTAMRQIAAREGYRYSPAPPYKILSTPWLTYPEICRIELIGRLLDLVYNSGRFRTLLALIREFSPLSGFFASLAEYWDSHSLTETPTMQELFASVWECCSSSMASVIIRALRDAIRYDFCLAGYPAARNLPFFAPDDVPAPLPGGSVKALVRELDVPPSGKIRTFSCSFGRDFRTFPATVGETMLLFVYISAPGRGEHVEVREPIPPEPCPPRRGQVPSESATPSWQDP
jgi:anaerobic magnesium-protoporphyrin IX monomethyl ester cyclase